jgi:hypothetical protein
MASKFGGIPVDEPLPPLVLPGVTIGQPSPRQSKFGGVPVEGDVATGGEWPQPSLTVSAPQFDTPIPQPKGSKFGGIPVDGSGELSLGEEAASSSVRGIGQVIKGLAQTGQWLGNKALDPASMFTDVTDLVVDKTPLPHKDLLKTINRQAAESVTGPLGLLPNPAREYLGQAKDATVGAALKKLDAWGRAIEESAPQSPSLNNATFLPGNSHWWAARAPEQAAQLATAIAAGLATKNPQLALGLAGAQQLGSVRGEALDYWKEQGLSDREAARLADQEATIIGLPTAVLEKLPLDTIFEKLPGGKAVKQKFISRLFQRGVRGLKAAGAEGGTEILQGTGEDAGAYLLRDQKTTPMEFAKRRLAEGTLGAVIGGPLGAIAPAEGTHRTTPPPLPPQSIPSAVPTTAPQTPPATPANPVPAEPETVTMTPTVNPQPSTPPPIEITPAIRKQYEGLNDAGITAWLQSQRELTASAYPDEAPVAAPDQAPAIDTNVTVEGDDRPETQQPPAPPVVSQSQPAVQAGGQPVSQGQAGDNQPRGVSGVEGGSAVGAGGTLGVGQVLSGRGDVAVPGQLPPVQTGAAPILEQNPPQSDGAGAPAVSTASGGEVIRAAQPQARPKNFTLPYAPLGVSDLLDFITENGGVTSRQRAQQLAESRGSRLGAEYDGYEPARVRGIYRNTLLSGNTPADVMAQMAHEAGHISEPTPDALWRGISQAITIRNSAKAVQTKELAETRQATRQNKNFTKDAFTKNKSGRQAVNTDNLKQGDRVKLGDEWLQVTDIKPDDFSVTLEDGERYGAQSVRDGQVLFVQQVKPVTSAVRQPTIPNPPLPPARPPQSFKGRAMQQWANRQTAKLRNAPRVVVVDTKEDLPDDEGGRMARDSRDVVEGYYNTADQTVYLIANDPRKPLTRPRARQILLHEIAGHYGLRGVLGEQFDEVMGTVWKMIRRGQINAGDLNAAVRRSGYDSLEELIDAYGGAETAAQQAVIAEELLARLQETDAPWYRRILNRIAAALEKIFGVKFEHDFIHDLLSQARAYAETGVRGDGANSASDRGIKPDELTGPQSLFSKRAGPTESSFEVSRQYAAVVAQYTNPDGTKKSGWMKAPNGQATKLTERQWVQVRTPKFKEWFGDWEKAARIDKLHKAESLKATGNEYQGRYELNATAAKRYINEHLRGVYRIDDTGEAVEISRLSANELMSHSRYNEAHLKSIALTPELIRGGIFIDEIAAKQGDTRFDSYRYYVAGLNMGGVAYTVKMVVGVKNDRKYYDHELSQIEKGNLIDSLDLLSNKVAANETSLSKIKDTRLLALLKSNPDEISKVVDENGEPRVVYHGTAREFDVFDSRSGLNFFSSDNQVASGYKEKHRDSGTGRVVQVFLNIRRPFMVDANGDYYAGLDVNLTDAQLNELGLGDETGIDPAMIAHAALFRVSQGNKYDGVIVDNVIDPGDSEDSELISTVYVMATPYDVKSATDNNGEFSGKHNDIRFAKRPKLDSSERDGNISRVSDAERAANPNNRTAPAGGDSESARLASNGRPSNLTDAEYARATSQEFKAKYGDWETLSKINATHNLAAIPVTQKTLSAGEAKNIYRSLGEVFAPDGKKVELVRGIFGKLAGHKNSALIFRLIPGLQDILEGAIHAYAENERNPAPGSIIKEFHNYVSKARLDGDDYFVRITVQELKDARNQLHNTFVSDIETAKAGNLRPSMISDMATKTGVGPADKKLVQWLNSVNPADIKIPLDENGEPVMSDIPAGGDARPNSARPDEGTPHVNGKEVPGPKFSKRPQLDSGERDGSISRVSDSERAANPNNRTAPAGGFSESARLAPNGRPSNLTDAEYTRATSPEFKAKYGDWAALGHRQFLDGEPVKMLTGDEFKKDLSLGLTERVEKFYQALGGVANSPVFGAVKLNKQGVKSSIAHGVGRSKAAAFAAVPEVIEQGRVIDWQENWKGRNHDTAVVAAPIQIAREDYVAAVVLKLGAKSNQFYLHEVYLKKKLREGAPSGASSARDVFKTGGVAPNGNPSSGSDSIIKLLRDIYAVNPESVKIHLDENGEPVMSTDGDGRPNLLRPDEGTPLFSKRAKPEEGKPGRSARLGRQWLDVAKNPDSRQYGEFLDHPLDEYEDINGIDRQDLRTLLTDLNEETARDVRIVRQFVDENDQVNQEDETVGREVIRLYDKAEPGSFIQINDPDGNAPSINSYYSNSEAATPIYQAIYAWAHNNGKVIVPDSVTTDTGLYRRNSQMLNSALRFGTTEHMRPNPENNLDWREGDHAYNIGEMARKEAEDVSELFNGLFDDWGYDISRDRFHDSQGAEIQPEQVKVRIEAAISQNYPKTGSAQDVGTRTSGRPRAGYATVRRALATRAFQESGRRTVPQSPKASRAGGTDRRNIAAGTAKEAPKAGLNKALYSKRKAPSGRDDTIKTGAAAGRSFMDELAGGEWSPEVTRLNQEAQAAARRVAELEGNDLLQERAARELEQKQGDLRQAVSRAVENNPFKRSLEQRLAELQGFLESPQTLTENAVDLALDEVARLRAELAGVMSMLEQQANLLTGGETAESPALPSADETLSAEAAFLYGPQVPSLWKPAGWSRFYQGTADILGGVKGLEFLSVAIRKHVDRARYWQGKVTAPFRAWERKWSLSKPRLTKHGLTWVSKEQEQAFKEFEDYFCRVDAPVTEVTALGESKRGAFGSERMLNVEGYSPAGQALIKLWQNQAVEMQGVNKKNRLVVWDDKIKAFRPIGGIVNYFPRTLRPEIKKLLNDPTSNPKLWRQVVGRLIDKGYVKDPVEALKFLNENFKPKSAFDYFSNIEAARQVQLPTMLYDYSFDAARRYLMSWSERTAQVEAFGQKAGRNGRDLFDLAQEKTINTQTKEYIEAVRQRAYGVTSKGVWARAMTVLNSLATGTQLSNPVTVFTNLTSGLAYNATSTGIIPALRGAWEMRSLARTAQAIAEAGEHGIILDDLMNMVNDVEQLDSSLASGAQRFAQFGLKWSGFSASETFVRAHGYLTGKAFLRSALKAWSGDAAGRNARIYEAWFERNGFDVDALRMENGEGEETARFLRGTVNLAQGGYRYDQVPVFMDTPAGRFLFKYQKWGSQMAANFVKNAITPAFRPGVDRDGKPRPRDFAPLISYLVVTAALGAGLDDLYERLFGRVKRGASWNEIATLADDDALKALELAVGKIFQAQLVSGAYGTFGNYAQTLQDFASRSKFKSPMDPPGLATLKNGGELLLRLWEQETLTASDIDDVMRGQVRAYATGKAAAARALDVLGADFRWQENELARQDVSWLNSVTRRYADELGVQNRRMGFSRIGKTPQSRYYDEVNRALLRGDSEGVRAAIDSYLATFTDADAKRAALKSLAASVSGRRPIKVGSAGEEREQLFLAWAGKNLSPSDMARVQDIDRRYKETAVRMGLLKPGGGTLNSRQLRDAERRIQWRNRTSSYNTLPEKPESLTAQLRLVADGRKPAMLVPKGTADSVQTEAKEAGLRAAVTVAGTFYYNPDRVTRIELRRAALQNRVGEVLGYGIAGKPDAEDAIGVVTVRDPQGMEKFAVATDEKNLPKVARAAAKVTDAADTVELEAVAEILRRRVT